MGDHLVLHFKLPCLPACMGEVDWLGMDMTIKLYGADHL